MVRIDDELRIFFLRRELIEGQVLRHTDIPVLDLEQVCTSVLVIKPVTKHEQAVYIYRRRYSLGTLFSLFVGQELSSVYTNIRVLRDPSAIREDTPTLMGRLFDDDRVLTSALHDLQNMLSL